MLNPEQGACKLGVRRRGRDEDVIRLVFLLRRRPELSVLEFQRYWREEHGPLVASHGRHIDVLRYVQVHTLDDPVNRAMAEARGGMEPPYDGVAELWWENRDKLAAALAAEAGQRAAAELLEDERQFIDLAASPLWLAHEYPQVNPTPENLVAAPHSTLAKLYFPLRALPGMDPAAAQFYWRTNHGPIIRRHAPASGLLRYLQVHRALDDELESTLRSSRGTQVDPYLGHAEVWIDRLETGRSPERTAAGRAAIEDESKFIDFARSSMWIGKEHVFVDHR
jgi:uncharacterized protein (TIGR02118 family)